ncbi:MAG: fibronectin type III domain-containing protein, partial [Actinomycetota bacterium]
MTLDNTPPDAVTALAGVAVASDTINLNWPSPGNNGAVDILTGAFTIQFTSVAVDAVNPVFWSTAATQVVVISTTGVQPTELQNYNIENLLSGVTYYFRLWTNDALANLSPLSNGATVIMPPNPPSAPLVLAVSSNTMSVSWIGNGIPGTSYLAEAGNDEAFTLNAVSTITVSTSHVFTGLLPNAVYFARVKTLGEGVIDSDFVNFTATATLSAPVTGAQYLDVFATSATLSWTDGVNPEGTSYEISVSSDSFATLNYSTTTVQLAYTPTALAPGTTYYFRTAALNSGGIKSGYAVFPATMTRAAVPVPNGVVFSSVTTDKVEVQWLQNGNPVSVEYMLQVSTASNFTGQSDIALGWSAWTAAVTVTPLDSGVTFYFQVKARDPLLRETAWRYLGVQRTDLGADSAPPSVINMQGGDDTWRGAASGSYKVRFHDGGAGLDKFEVKLATSPGLAGAPLTGWTVAVSSINAADYATDWQLPLTAFEAIPEGVTAYVSVRVYDNAAPTPNVTVSTDVFYVIRDTTPPTITNNAVSPSGWQFADPGVFDVDFADARAGLASIQYSASGSAGAADAALLPWTVIDSFVSSSAYTTDWGVAFAALTGGTTNYISARAIDAAGNATTRSDVFKIMKAADSPLVALISPSAAYISTAASLSGSAYGGNDGITINYVEAWLQDLGSGKYYDGAAGTFTSAAPVWLRASGAESWTLNISTFGTVNLSSYTAVARSLDSVARYSLTYATVTFTLDQDVPSVYLSSPVALSTVSVFDVITGTAADTDSGPAMAGVSVKRVIDGKWWDFAARVWGSAQVSSMTPVAGG